MILKRLKIADPNDIPEVDHSTRLLTLLIQHFSDSVRCELHAHQVCKSLKPVWKE